MHGGNVHLIQREMGIPLNEIMDFSANINPLGVPPRLKELILEALEEVMHYPDPDYNDLYHAVAEFYGCNPQQLYLGNGAAHVMHHLIGTIKPGRAMLTAPTFSEYRRALQGCGAEIQEYLLNPDNSFDLEPEKLTSRLGGMDLLVLCNPNNPTGRMIPRDSMQHILKACAKNQCHLMVDEAFMDFSLMEDITSLIPEANQWKNLTIIRAFTKIFAIPGLRLGAAICGNPSLAEQLRLSAVPWSINTFAASLSAYLNTRDAGEYLCASKNLVNQERTWLKEALGQIPQLRVIDGSVNYLLVNIRRGNGTAAALRHKLVQQGIVIRDCSNMNGLDETWFRTAVKTRHENEALVDCLKRALMAP